MANIDRRTFLRVATTTVAAGAVTPDLAVDSVDNNKRLVTSPAKSAPEVTPILARYIVSARYEDLPANVRKEGLRTLLNWVGVAVGGSRHETVNIAVEALAPFSGPPHASILGRRERFDAMNAAFINGVSSHIFDYDDTHPKTIIHPAGPVVSAILALAEHRPMDGRNFLSALVVGIETECRIGNAVYPDHYDRGWHITGTAGVFGAAASAGKLLGLSEQQMIWALGLAASQPVGFRESFGSMNKSFNPGRAASNGLFAAFLASKNFTSSEQMIEAKRGWANTISTKQDYKEITDGLGKHYESTLNTYKPFACGIVMHPAIDAAIHLREQYQLNATQIETIHLRVNPLVLELTGKKTPTTGLEGKFSIYHAVAVAIVEGAAGERQFSDRAVQDRTIVNLRSCVVPVVDTTVELSQVEMTMHLKDGRQLAKSIQHAKGSLEAPMTDDDIESKFGDLAKEILPPDRIRALIDLCWNLEKLSNAGAIAKAAVPI